MKDRPEGLFGRHDSCKCMILYDGQVLRGRVGENGRRNRTWVEDKTRAQRIEYANAAPKPVKYTPEQARTLESNILAQNALTNGANGGIINVNEETERIRQEVIPNLKTDRIVPRQDIHRQGTDLYETRKENLKSKGKFGPSYLTISDEKILELVDRYKGQGVLKFNKNGEWTRQEVIVTNDELIGVAINDLTGKAAQTSVFKIHYGDDGIHIVPDYPSKKR